jgi:7-cyano-7-deazaguanine synthase
MKAVVLLSGGIDSTVCAMMAGNNFGFDRLLGLSFAYGQKHAKELEASRAVAERIGMGGFEVIDIPPVVFKGAGSTLVDEDKHIPLAAYPNELGPVSTYVPFRNGIFISIAVATALRYSAGAVYFGAHAEDALNWAYPDCTPEFIGAMKNAAWTGTYHKVRLITPLEWLTKSEIIDLGRKLNTPFELTWSCYQGREKACGKCATCISRMRAFEAEGLQDPIAYENERNGRHA